MSVTNSIVLGFSFTGASIPAGDGVLVNLGSDDCTSDSFSGFVFAGPGGSSLSVAMGGGSEPVLGCTDQSACNYDSDATEDDGSCEYAAENFDCAGNCTAEVDCAGTCAGDAVADECGECNGNGSSCATSEVDILYSSDADIAGFQFNVNGVTVEGAAGGAAAANGFSVTASQTVLGFSFTGAVIPAG